VNGSQPTRTQVFDDVRAVERELARTCARRSDPVGERVLVLVPSAAARVHVAGRLVRACGGALVGVRVLSLLGYALETLAAARVGVRASGVAGALELERALAASPRLFGVLGSLDDGARVGARAVEELVAAGLDEHTVDAALEALEDLAPGLAGRTRELLAAAVLRAPNGACAGGANVVFARAAECIDGREASANETRLLLGLEHASGPRADFAQALLRRGARFLATRGARGALTQRLALESGAAALRTDGLALVNAPDPRSAARAAARAVAEALARGTRHEDVLVVCADPEDGTLALARAFDELGVPFAAPGAGFDLALHSRPLAALANMLERRADTSASTLAAACDDAPFARELLARGAVGLEDVNDARGRAAAAFCESLGGARADVARWNLTLVRFAERTLGWQADGALARRLATLLADLADAFASDGAADFALTGDEWARLVAQRLAASARAPLGGSAGVQVVAPDAALGRAADLVVLVCFTRGVFPRRRGDDALLDERARNALVRVLPDLATASEARARDEALVDQLLGAGDAVVVVHAEHDAKGRETPLSPVLARRLADRGVKGRAAPRAGSLADAAAGPLTELEWARAAGLERSGTNDAAAERTWRALLEPLHAAPEVALAHAANVLEHDSERADLCGLGRLAPGSVVRNPFVTRLERFAECAWAAHLENDLRLVESPNGALATPDTRAVGTAVHAALDALLGAAVAKSGDLDAHAAHTVPQPSARAVEAALERGVSAALADAAKRGIPLERIAGARVWLTARSRPLLEIGVRELWQGGDPLVLAAEREFVLPLATPAGTFELKFRADLVTLAKETDADGGEVHVRIGTDFKTGATKEQFKGDATRSRKVERDLLRGVRLQAAVYAAALRGRGRYLYLGGDLDSAWPRSTTIECDVADAHLPQVVARIERAREVGAFLPRLVQAKLDDEKQPDACGRCRVAGACVQGDTLWRERLRRFAREAPERIAEDGDEYLAHAYGWFTLDDQQQNEELRGDE
jgi:hypothetical protein